MGEEEVDGFGSKTLLRACLRYSTELETVRGQTMRSSFTDSQHTGGLFVSYVFIFKLFYYLNYSCF